MNLCHKYLSSKHRTPACKRTNTCGVDDCSGAFHYTLLYRFIDSKKLYTREKSTSTSDTIENTNVSRALVSNKICLEREVIFKIHLKITASEIQHFI